MSDGDGGTALLGRLTVGEPDEILLISGVATIINKLNGHPFDENDEQLFEAFTIFCGLGIHNTIMYSEVEKAMARQKVAIEVLSYHATASNKELEALMVSLPSHLFLPSFLFKVFCLFFCQFGVSSRINRLSAPMISIFTL